jgi:hypothetical protein
MPYEENNPPEYPQNITEIERQTTELESPTEAVETAVEYTNSAEPEVLVLTEQDMQENYQLIHNSEGVLRLSDHAVIPADEGNKDWVKYLKWSEVRSAQPVETFEQQAPQIVTMRQARLALLGAGKLSLVEAAIDALPEPPKTAAKIEWEYSQEVHRNKPFVQMLAQGLGLSQVELDQLFIAAATL